MKFLLIPHISPSLMAVYNSILWNYNSILWGEIGRQHVKGVSGSRYRLAGRSIEAIWVYEAPNGIWFLNQFSLK